ncbi:MAG: carboxypeptidase-like regulatory domain-containing protein, partial [Ferruginibacter sp.]
MKKTILIIVLAALCLNFRAQAQANKHLTGRVTDSIGNPLQGATIKLKSSQLSVSADKNGNFIINVKEKQGTLIINFIGYKSIEVNFSDTENVPFKITMFGDQSSLKEVSVVSTGYQTIPKDRATGSFVLIDSALLNRRVSTNILDRLDGVTSGLIFSKSLGEGNNAAITIRGRSTIFANPDPLI